MSSYGTDYRNIPIASTLHQTTVLHSGTEALSVIINTIDKKVSVQASRGKQGLILCSSVYLENTSFPV